MDLNHQLMTGWDLQCEQEGRKGKAGSGPKKASFLGCEAGREFSLGPGSVKGWIHQCKRRSGRGAEMKRHCRLTFMKCTMLPHGVKVNEFCCFRGGLLREMERMSFGINIRPC